MRRPTLGVFLLTLAVYHANGRAAPEVDCAAAPYTAWALARNASLDLRSYPPMAQYVGTHVRELPDGQWVSIRPPGAALMAVPVVLPFTLFREEPLKDRDMHHLGKLAAALCAAGAAALFFIICRRHAPAAAGPATVLFAFGTTLWSCAGQALWMHAPAVFWLTLALYLVLRPGGWAVAAGLSLGMAVVCRPTAGLFAAASFVALACAGRWKDAAKLTAGGLIPAGGLVALNWAVFGSPGLGGYDREIWAEPPPLWVGLGGLLVAPGRGLLVYSPALIVMFPGLVRLLRGRDFADLLRPVALAWAAAAAGTVLFYARWWCWWGGWCYGPRLLTEALPACCLLFAVGYECLTDGWRKLARGLVALSVMVQLVGVAGDRGYAAWHERQEPMGDGRKLFEWDDTQIAAHARATWADLSRRLPGGK